MYPDEARDLLLLLFPVFPVICEDEWDTQGQKNKQKVNSSTGNVKGVNC